MGITPSRIVDLFSAEAAGRVLAGDWVRLFPLFQGEGYWRGGFFHPLTAEMLQEMERIFKQRAELGLPARLAVNAEHDSTGGAFGWIVDFEARADGGYVRIEPTKRGRELLEDDSFAYLSAEVYWEYELPTTGQAIGPVLSGAAFTNDPFFGEATAMYSRRVIDRILSRYSDNEPATEEERVWARSMLTELVGGLLNLVQELGWTAQDIRWLNERGVVTLDADLDEPRKGLVLALAEAAGALPDLYSRLSGQPATSGSPDNTGPTPRDTGGNRMSEELVLTPEEQTGLQRFMHDPLGFLFGRQGQGTEPGNADGGGEEFGRQMDELRAQMQRQAQQLEQFAAVAAERDELRGRVESLEGQLSGEQSRQLAERFSRQAQSYRALGADVDELAGQLQWLYTADTSENRAHFAWFEALLASTDESLAAGEAFSERGQGGQGPIASGPQAQFNNLVAQKMEGGLAHGDAVAAVARENPSLYQQAFLPAR